MVDIKEQSPLTLAFVGDAVYSLLIRQHLATQKRYTIHTLHYMAVQYVSAKGQFAALKLIEDMLTDEEKTLVKRGQNSSKATVSKHATPQEYRASTGFECLIGYLQLCGRQDRINEIVDYILANLTFDNSRQSGQL